jgi:glutaredoxin 3
MAAPVLIYSTRVCPYCVRAKALLDSKQVTYIEVMVDQDPGKLTEMMQKSGRRTVPQIFVGDRHVGGFDDLHMLDRSGGLDPLLAGG